MTKYCYDYARPALTADTVALAGPAGARKALLIRRGAEPYLGRWALPGGFVDEGERLEDAARRELAEETGLAWSGAMIPVAAFGDPGRDPRGWNVCAAYVADVGPEMPEVLGGDDAAEAAWFPLDALPSPLAFDHDEIVEAAVRRLRSVMALR
ncbi:MAG: NUDIX hydrolase [Coriobacteriia bacterium]|nr:NUDIX hydrolase [Coriobacteriia bacterium]